MDTSFENNFRVPTAFMWLLTVLNFIPVFAFAFGLTDLVNSPFQSGIFFGILVVTLLIFLADALTSEIYNKTVWIIILILIPMVTYVIYLIQRKKLLGLQRKKVKFGGE
jgi:apolipoprotein N-acyltransferase